MRYVITALTTLAFLSVAYPVHSMSMFFAGASVMDASASPVVQAYDYANAVSNTLNKGLVPADDRAELARASIIELPPFMHAWHPGDSDAFSALRTHFQIAGAGIAERGTELQVRDLIFMLFLGIGMLSLGSLRKRQENVG